VNKSLCIKPGYQHTAAATGDPGNRMNGASAPARALCGTGQENAMRARSKNDVFDAKNEVFGSKRAEIEGLLLLIS
jgi:hypothetical protein